MTDKLDRRKARTRQLLHDALMALLQEKSAESITVTDVTGRADVNRGTFYLHYRDVGDMVQQLKDEVMTGVRARVEKLDISAAMQYIDRDEPYPVSVSIFEEIAKHGEFLRIMLGEKGDLSFARQLRELFASRVHAKLSTLSPNESAVPLDYLISYIASANFGIVTHWLDTGRQLTPAQMAKVMISLMNYGPLVSSGIRKRL
ncbi:transcriptional regulator, TetR family [Cohnella sp. OV330]|uniref:TetR/AcrR family transcriptional regulator n=1 Tax=Cohnella sp. OV330 TaxID=1855288 RepID=UPI0008EA7A65|nr:TetR/AcrR family transcriptional regulator [Cohnella sp. OV330]SFB56440.1 transcriptional regulator, TetR family [Cohnella sp. OV330]